MQKIILKGRLGRDSEVTTIGERQQLKFSIACDYGKGERVNTTWYDILYFKTSLQQYLTKGTEVIVSGRLDVRKSEGRDGKTYVNLTVYADDLEFCGRAKTQGQGDARPEVPQNRADAPQQASFDISGTDDIPF